MSKLIYKLTIHPDMDNCKDTYDTFKFETKSELTASINTTSQLLIFLQDKVKLMPDCSNMFVSEKLINGEWVDFFDLDEK